MTRQWRGNGESINEHWQRRDTKYRRGYLELGNIYGLYCRAYISHCVYTLSLKFALRDLCHSVNRPTNKRNGFMIIDKLWKFVEIIV